MSSKTTSQPPAPAPAPAQQAVIAMIDTSTGEQAEIYFTRFVDTRRRLWTRPGRGYGNAHRFASAAAAEAFILTHGFPSKAYVTTYNPTTAQ